MYIYSDHKRQIYLENKFTNENAYSNVHIHPHITTHILLQSQGTFKDCWKPGGSGTTGFYLEPEVDLNTYISY